MPTTTLTAAPLTAALLLAPATSAQTWTASPSLQPARTNHAAVSSGGLAFFAGGGSPFVGYDATVNVYDSSAGTPSDPAAWSVATLSQARAQVAAVSVGGKVLFAGGNHQGFSLSVSDRVDVYDIATNTWSDTTLSEARTGDAATSVAGYALFAGGDPNDLGTPGPPSARVDVYEAATDTWSQATLSAPRLGVKATSVGPYALFGGGYTFTFGGASDVVEVYDSTVGPPSDPSAWSVVHLSQPRGVGAATTAGGKAFFAGGSAEVAPGVYETVATVDVYDSHVGPPSDPAAWSVTQLSTPRVFLTATSQGHEALFAGGVRFFDDGTSAHHDVVDVFDTCSGSWSTEALSVPRLAVATSVGAYALVAGGEDDAFTPSDVVDARRVADGHWYVDVDAAAPGDGSPASPFTRIQDGLDAAAPGDTVLVAPGHYAEHLVVTQDVSIVSTCGRTRTTITRDWPTNTPLLTTTDASLTVRGFEFNNGQAPRGGGMFVSGGDVRVEDCAFLLCRAGTSMTTGQGGAIYVASGELEIEGTSFRMNVAAGVGQGGAIHGSPHVRSCSFAANRAEGTVQQGARGSAIFGNPRIENSAFDRNSAYCLFPIDNGVPSVVVNSTFVDNGSYVFGAGTTVRNSIFWGFLTGVSIGGSGSMPDLEFCIVKNGYPGLGNSDRDPMFVAPVTGIDGLRLRPDSPAIDAGDNTAVPAGLTHDLWGGARTVDDWATRDTGLGTGAIVDIGAFELQSHRPRAFGGPPVIAP